MLLKSQIFNTFSFKLILLSSVFCLFLSLILNEFIQNLLIFSGILSFGIIHGANDLSLLKIKINNNDSFVSLLIPYLIMVISFGIFFYLFPSLALMFFVLFSSYHFGEQQWTMFVNKKEKKLEIFYFIYGLFIFSFLFWLNNSFVSEIVLDITGFNVDLKFYDYLLYFSIAERVIKVPNCRSLGYDPAAPVPLPAFVLLLRGLNLKESTFPKPLFFLGILLFNRILLEFLRLVHQ